MVGEIEKDIRYWDFDVLTNASHQCFCCSPQNLNRPPDLQKIILDDFELIHGRFKAAWIDWNRANLSRNSARRFRRKTSVE
jgi:hypothetical protein